MTDRSRKFGFLRPKERAYLNEEGHYLAQIDEETPERPPQTKTRLKNEVVQNFDEVIRDFRLDLLAVSNFQRAATLHEQFVWENSTLDFTKSELKTLKTQIEGLIEQAKTHPISAERKELTDVLESLYKAIELEDPAESNPDPDREKVEEYIIEQNQRRKEMNQHLKTVLAKEGLPDLLSHIGNEGKCSLEKERINGEGEWQEQVVSRELVPDLATKDTNTVGSDQYELTEKGEAVLGCWEELQETRTIEIKSDLQPESSMRELVLETLAEHFPENYSD